MPSNNTSILFVNHELKDCVGVGPMKCMQVRESSDDEWSYFYAQIEGFEFEEGFTYELRVTQTEIEDPPADASSVKYTLVEVVSKTEYVPEPFVRTDIYTKTWRLVSYSDGKETYEVPETSVMTLEVDQESGRCSGSTGCNTFSNSIKVDGQLISFGNGMKTLMACEDEAMRLENEYMRLLGTIERVSLNRSAFLDLMGKDGEMLRFMPTE